MARSVADQVSCGPLALRGLIPSFLAFVFTMTRCAAFLALALVPVCLAAFLGAELTFFVRAFPRFETVPFRANACFFRLAMTVSH